MPNARTSLILLAPFIFAKVLAQCELRIPIGAPLPGSLSTIGAARGGGPQYVVPTVVHVHYGGDLLPIGALQVQAWLVQCNADLRALGPQIAEVVPEFQGVIGDMAIELRLATRDEQGNCMSGIRYHYYNIGTEQPAILQNTLNTRGYLNIHVRGGSSFATLPGPISNPYDPYDVVMVSSGQANLNGHTLAHEVGHWFGLYHVWGTAPTTGACGDDYIADTPITAGSQLDCILDQAECATGVVENVQNFMDYSGCRVMFTQGQAAHAIGVLGNTDLVRNSLVTEQNLLAAGITDPSSCPISALMHYRTSIGCGATALSFRAMAEYALADSVRWTFTGGTPAASTEDHVEVTYTSSGSYPVQLIVYGGGTSATVISMVNVEVPNPTGNGLALITEFPFTQGFESGFTLPNPNMVAVNNGIATWQPFVQAGYASDRSLYVPALFGTQGDTIDLVLGNFDLSTLVQPTVRFKIASSYHALANWSKIELHFRDLCSTIFMGNPWAIWQLNEFATDHGPNYMPSDDSQWQELNYTYWVWSQATGGEIKLRLIRNPMGAGTVPEAVYIDDLYVGELPLVTGLDDAPTHPSFALAPNPTNGAFVIELRQATMLTIVDALGRTVHQQRIGAGRTSISEALAPGAYLVRLEDGRVERLVVH
jgi:PKD repeat protein